MKGTYNSEALAVLQLFCVLDTRMCVTKSYVLFSWLVSKIYTGSHCELGCDCGCNLLPLHVQSRGGMLHNRTQLHCKK